MAFSLALTQLTAASGWLLAAEESDPVNPLLGWAPFLLIGLALYFFAIRPQRKRAESVRGFQESLAVGDEIRTAGGIIGVVNSLSDTEVMVDVGGVTMKFIRGAIAGPAGGEDS